MFKIRSRYEILKTPENIKNISTQTEFIHLGAHIEYNTPKGTVRCGNCVYFEMMCPELLIDDQLIDDIDNFDSMQDVICSRTSTNFIIKDHN